MNITIETKELVISEELKRKIEIICSFAYVDYTITNCRIVMRIMTSVSQNEIEKCSERTKFGMVGAIKSGYIPNHSL